MGNIIFWLLVFFFFPYLLVWLDSVLASKTFSDVFVEIAVDEDSEAYERMAPLSVYDDVGTGRNAYTGRYEDDYEEDYDEGNGDIPNPYYRERGNEKNYWGEE